MTLSRKDMAAEAAAKSAILELLGKEKIDRIAIAPTEDHLGEPALSVAIFLKADQKRMSGRILLDTIAAASTALREIEDDRFPYVTFLAPEDESAEDTRPAA